MRNLIIILIIALAGCTASRVPAPSVTIITKDSIVEKEVIRYRTDTTIIPGDTIKLQVAIPCPDLVYHKKVENGNTSLVLDIKDGLLTADCQTDSLLHIVDSLQETIKERQSWHSSNETKTLVNTVEKIKYKIPKWCWYLLLLNVVYIIFKFRSPISFAIKTVAGFIVKKFV